jgi:hypothetical protein
MARPILASASTLLVLLAAMPASAEGREDPHNFVFVGGDRAAAHAALLARADIDGIQVVYPWRMLEPEPGRYDFSAIEADLATADRLGKHLFAQVQDRFFSPEARHLPDYILEGAAYDGGLAQQYDNPGEGRPVAQGWAAKQWNQALRTRFQALLRALAERFDGRLYGLNLPETAVDLAGTDESFTCDAYFAAALDNMAAARAAFARTQVVQYVNFWPCEWDNDHRYMERAFAFAAERGIGLGGPDIVPWRRGQMKNSYPFFNRYAGKLPLVALAVQEPTLSYTNPQTGERFTRAEFVEFARDYLAADIVFWSAEAPWFTEE